MDLTFTRIEGRSTAFRVLSVGLAALVIAGGYATWVLATQGLHLTGMTTRIPWGLPIVMAIFYIGLSAGSLVVSSLYGVFGKLEYKPFARVATFLAMLLMIGALLSIMTDQGRIDRFFAEPFTHANPLSMLSINPFLYFSYIAICAVYLLVLAAGSERWTKVLALVAVLWAILVHSGTGAIFGFVPRGLYDSPLLPPSFVAAALSSGTALMLLVLLALFRLTGRPLDEARLLWVGRLLAVLVLVAGYFVLIENAHRLYAHESRTAELYFLFGGSHSLLFWGGLVLAGTVVPPLILLRRKTGASLRWAAFAAVLVVVGVLCERYLIVIPGLAHPPELVPGWTVIVSPIEEGIASYAVSGLELMQAAGVSAFIALSFLWGLKLLALAPAAAGGSSGQVVVNKAG